MSGERRMVPEMQSTCDFPISCTNWSLFQSSWTGATLSTPISCFPPREWCQEGVVILQPLMPSVKVKVTQSYSTLCDPMGYIVHGILQARILEWEAFPFSRGSSQPRDRTQVSHIAGGFFTSLATMDAQEYWRG